MTDIVKKETRSRMMAGIRGKHTRPELELRRALHADGYRYRLHAKKISGQPDLVLRKYRAIIFVHGCFWHRHGGCRFTTTPSTRTEFWNRKFASNTGRDKTVREALLDAGWRIATIWECALRKPQQAKQTVARLEEWLHSNVESLEIGETDVTDETVSNLSDR